MFPLISVGGHDSCEDALAALDLMKFKVREDVKILQQKAAKQANARK
jgi:DNA polymerase III epsilon subunit-like protein